MKRRGAQAMDEGEKIRIALTSKIEFVGGQVESGQSESRIGMSNMGQFRKVARR